MLRSSAYACALIRGLLLDPLSVRALPHGHLRIVAQLPLENVRGVSAEKLSFPCHIPYVHKLATVPLPLPSELPIHTKLTLFSMCETFHSVKFVQCFPQLHHRVVAYSTISTLLMGTPDHKVRSFKFLIAV